MNKVNHDLTKVLDPKKYADKWVAMNAQQTKVLLAYKSPNKVLDEAKKKGYKDAVITFVPKDYAGLVP